MSAPLAGILVVTRHGDRQGFYQSPTTYTASQTNLTVLGYLQELQNGNDLRQTYLLGNDSIQGIAPDIAESLQLNVLADAGGEGGVIVDSANALLQGLYPPTAQNLTLANGTIVAWNSRAQPIVIETIEPDQDVWMEGYTECNTWTTRLNDLYTSGEFKANAVQANAFYNSIAPILGNRPLSLQNAWNIFDYLNVEFIHNSTLMNLLGDSNREQARFWADYHERLAFSDPDPKNIGNVAGQAFLPPLLDNLNQIANQSNPLKITYMAASYKPFMSLFAMMKPAGLPLNVVDYASAAIFEVRTDSTIRFLFRNGTDGPFVPYGLFSDASASDALPLSTFKSKMQPYSLDTLASWCDACGTIDERGCAPLAKLNGTGGAGYASPTTTDGHHRVSPVVAGVIGAVVSLAVAAALLAAWVAFGAAFRRRPSRYAPHSEEAKNRTALNNPHRPANPDDASSLARHTSPSAATATEGSAFELPDRARDDDVSSVHTIEGDDVSRK